MINDVVLQEVVQRLFKEMDQEGEEQEEEETRDQEAGAEQPPQQTCTVRPVVMSMSHCVVYMLYISIYPSYLKQMISKMFQDGKRLASSLTD